ncbi:TrmH family RNA methyltransferase [Roseitalea porphyridii]|uniref:RNA methyltransferase n=1 Tax=Roseitalea porphyridii TaxID=1852022 RepID=A0A4P6UZJ7_9HYPH|nr:RNA methyltransferase [Roseitalea porphyridii]QBK30557.1 RNA methyltransferase [Roseitalea porphyridii]
MSQHDKPGRKDAHYARLRRDHRDRKRARGETIDPAAPPEGRVHLYGLHTVRAALDNPGRTIHRLLATENALSRLGIADPSALPFPVEIVRPPAIDALTGADAVHQGVLVEADALSPLTLEDLGAARLVVVLDQVTDPHNVGALMRSAVAMAADALITTARHSPAESGVLAKAASGALEHLPLIHVRNLANALGELNNRGFQTIGLDSEGPHPIEQAFDGDRIAIVLGAEGKGLREKTRATVADLARLDMPGAIRSLNVSNAAVLALYLARRHLDATR